MMVQPNICMCVLCMCVCAPQSQTLILFVPMCLCHYFIVLEEPLLLFALVLMTTVN